MSLVDSLEQVLLDSGVLELAEFFFEGSLARMPEEYSGKLLLAHYQFFLWVLDSVFSLFLYCLVFKNVAPMDPKLFVVYRVICIDCSASPRLLLTIWPDALRLVELVE